jgi:hypothetical protein
MLKLESFYHEILCSFFIFLTFFVTIFTSEALLHGRSKATGDYDGLIGESKLQIPLESNYTDIYYLVYMYSIMGITLTGMFICVS